MKTNRVVTHIILVCKLCHWPHRWPIEDLGEAKLEQLRCPECKQRGWLTVVSVETVGSKI